MILLCVCAVSCVCCCVVACIVVREPRGKAETPPSYSPRARRGGGGVPLDCGEGERLERPRAYVRRRGEDL